MARFAIFIDGIKKFFLFNVISAAVLVRKRYCRRNGELGGLTCSLNGNYFDYFCENERIYLIQKNFRFLKVTLSR